MLPGSSWARRAKSCSASAYSPRLKRYQASAGERVGIRRREFQNLFRQPGPLVGILPLASHLALQDLQFEGAQFGGRRRRGLPGPGSFFLEQRKGFLVWKGVHQFGQDPLTQFRGQRAIQEPASQLCCLLRGVCLGQPFGDAVKNIWPDTLGECFGMGVQEDR